VLRVRRGLGEPNRIEALDISLNVTVDVSLIYFLIVPLDLIDHFMGCAFLTAT
jgi:hypothetical protein